MFILVRLTQHVSSIIMLIVRRTDYTKKKLRVMNACNTEKNLFLKMTDNVSFQNIDLSFSITLCLEAL